MNLHFSLLTVIIFLFNFSFAQKTFEFKTFKSVPDGKVVYFDISGIKDNDHSDELVKVLSQINGVSFCRIFKSSQKTDICQMNINNSVSADYVRDVLLSKETDFYMGSVNVLKPVTVIKAKAIEKRRDGMPEHHPVYQGTGDILEDQSQYDKEKLEWSQKYPEEVKALREGKVIIKDENIEPEFIDTGNTKIDAENYDKAKQQWYTKKNKQVKIKH